MGHTKEQKRLHSQKVREERRKFAYEFLGNCCIRCGSTQNLEIDHIDPATKLRSVSQLWTASKVVFEAELNKCQLLCKPHHVEKTIKDQYGEIEHGVNAFWRRCKCPICWEARLQYQRDWRAKRKQ